MDNVKKFFEAFALGAITTGVELVVGRAVLKGGISFLSKCVDDLNEDNPEA